MRGRRTQSDQFSHEGMNFFPHTGPERPGGVKDDKVNHFVDEPGDLLVAEVKGDAFEPILLQTGEALRNDVQQFSDGLDDGR